MSRSSSIPILCIVLPFLFFHNAIVAQRQVRSKKIIDSLIRIIANQKEDTNKAINLMWLSRLEMGQAQNTGNWDEAIIWCTKTLKVSQKTNYDWGVGKSYMYLGQCWGNKGDYSESIKQYYGALKLSFKNGNKGLTVASSTALADCYTSLGNYEEALKDHLIAYKAQVALGTTAPLDPHQIAAGISGAYTKLHQFDKALEWYQKEFPYDSTNFYEGDLELQLASIYMEMKNYDEALKNYRNGVEIFPKRFKREEEMSTVALPGMWYEQLGEIYFTIGRLTKGNEQITSFHEAIKYLNKSLPLLGNNAGGKESLMKAYDLLKQACEATNDYENAMHYVNLYTGMRDSIYSKENYSKIAELKVKFETEKAEALMNANREKDKIKEKAIRDSLLAVQNLKHENEINNEKLKEARSSAAQQIDYQTSLAKQEKISAEKQRTNNLLLMGLILVVITSGFLVLYLRQRHLKKRAIEKAQAVHKMAELELQSLRSQLNPHFMFNSLNSLQRLILMEENDKSQSYLARFSKMLRILLENADKPFVSLQKEIDFLQLYLGLEKLRIPDLQYSISTDPSINTEETLMPNMILQPYVENAIWHGLSHKEDNKQLQIRIYRENGTVNCEIEDNGVGRKKAEELKSLFRKEHQSKGMELLTKRFRLLNEEYGSEIRSTITDLKRNEEDSGVLVTVKVPVMLSQQMQN